MMFLFNKLCSSIFRFNYSLLSSNTYTICSLYLWIGFNRSIFFSIRLFIMNCLLFNKMPNISFCILCFNGLHFLLGFYISQIYQLLCMQKSAVLLRRFCLARKMEQGNTIQLFVILFLSVYNHCTDGCTTADKQ